MIALRTVLEMLAPDIWYRQYADEPDGTKSRIPSLEEYQKLIEKLLPRAEFDGCTLSFCHWKSTITKIPRFNYLLVYSEAEVIESPFGKSSLEYPVPVWDISGFETLADMDHFIRNDDSICRIQIHIWTGKRYEKAMHAFTFCFLDGHKSCVSEQQFMFPNNEPNLDYLDSDYQRKLEIIGLYEFHVDNQVFLRLASSVHNLMEQLGDYANERESNWTWEYVEETGHIYYENGIIISAEHIWTYSVRITSNCTEWNISNEDGKSYCVERHRFCTSSDMCCEKGKRT